MAHYAERRDHRCRTNPRGPTRRPPLGVAPRRPGRPAAEGPARAHRSRSGPDRRRDHGVHHAGGRAGHEHRPQRRAGGGVPRLGSWYDGRSAVRVGSAGHSLRGPGGHVGGHGDRNRRRHRVDEPGTHRFDHRAGAGRGLRTPLSGALRAHPPGGVRRGDRAALEDRARGHGPLRAVVPSAGGPGHRRGSLRQRDRSPRGPGAPRRPGRRRRHRVAGVRRGCPPGHVAGEAGGSAPPC